MSLKRLLLSVATLLLSMASLNATDTLHYDVSNFIVGILSPRCVADTTELSVVVPCVCMGSRFINIEEKFNQNCNAITCNALSTSLPNIEGGNVISTNPNPTLIQGLSCGSSISWTAKVSPDTTTSYIIHWDEFKRENFSSCGLWDRVHVFHFRDTFTVNVQYVPIPLISVSDVSPACGESIELNLENCNSSFTYSIINDCGRFVVPLDYCDSEPVSLDINSLGRFNYKARFTHRQAPFCLGKWSSLSEIIVDDVSFSNSCSDYNDVISEIEELLTDSVLIQNSSDYHYYQTEEIICTAGSNNSRSCEENEIWSFWKSNVGYQAPRYDDFPSYLSYVPSTTLQLFQLGLGLLQPSNSNPILDCQQIDLPLVADRILLSIGLAFAVDSNPIDLCDTSCEPEVFREPIVVVIDEACKCITNYTLPGHVLYPGKVRRCLIRNDCDTFSIKTWGTGYHFCGDTILGQMMGIANKSVGLSTFSNVTRRLVNDFNN